MGRGGRILMFIKYMGVAECDLWYAHSSNTPSTSAFILCICATQKLLINVNWTSVVLSTHVSMSH